MLANIIPFVLIGLFFALATRFLNTVLPPLFSPLRHIPGPFLARFTKIWYFKRLSQGQFEKVDIALHRKYAKEGQYFAPIVRIGPKQYSIAAAEKNVYGIHSKMPKADWYDGWKHPSPDRWTVFTERDMKKHSETRRKFQALYSMSSLLSYESYVDECAVIFQKRLEEISQRQDFVNMGHWFQCYAFDVIGDITFSKRFGFLDGGDDVGGTIQALDNVMKYSTLVGLYPRLHPYLYYVMEKLPGSGAAGRTFLMNYMGDRIKKRRQERKEKGIDSGELESGLSDEKIAEVGEDDFEDGELGGDDKPEDFMDKVLNAERDGKKGVTPYHSFMMGMSNIIAGSDTTAVSLSSILYNLIKTPRAMQKLREETEAFTKEGKCDAERVGFKDAQNMRYLQACLKEGMRLHAATGLPLWRVVPQGGAEICGQWFPAGTEIGVNTWVAHYNEDVWGKDAREFRPERWIEAEDEGGERMKTMEASYMPFGAGSRTCLGRHISYLEMTKLIPQIVRRFDFELEHTNREWETRNFWFVKPVDFVVKVKVRTSNAG